MEKHSYRNRHFLQKCNIKNIQRTSYHILFTIYCEDYLSPSIGGPRQNEVTVFEKAKIIELTL